MSVVRPPNRLVRETSPYLRQHAHNPVDWYPWGDEAFERARRLDRPVFLSIGYSACHWCHVMERESFENETIAAYLNERFVSIKVDREERPDVDDVYMTAVQVTSGRGGWPLSAFLLPDRRPFFAGTYFPPDDRGGRIGFQTLLTRVVEGFASHRRDLEETASQIASELDAQSRLTERQPPRALDEDLQGLLLPALRRSFDPAHGGFGGAPKFPPHGALEALLASGEREMSEKTLEAMALGGVHDHLGGGFHRYSTDERWLLPHFEKMLTDNGQLLGLYAEAYRLTGRPFFARVARGIGDYLLREMRGPEGAFYAATDADSEGEEGKFFVFTEDEVTAVLGADDAAFLGRAYQVRRHGNFHDESTGRATGANILHLVAEPVPGDEARLAPLREKLRVHRMKRVPPGLDDKRILGWNALAVSGLSLAAKALAEPRYLEAAAATARFLLTAFRDAEGRLCRTWKDGTAKIPAFLEDEAYLANALLDLTEAGADFSKEARETVDDLRARFQRKDAPGFTFSGEGNEDLLMKGRDLFDKAIPSGSGSAVRALVRVASSPGDRPLLDEAREALAEVSWLMARSPHGMETWFLALRDLLGAERRLGRVPVGMTAAHGPVQVTAHAEPDRVAPGTSFDVTLSIAVAGDYQLVADGGLVVEAWAGSGFRVSPAELPPAGADGWAGTFGVRLTIGVSPDTPAGPRLVSVVVKTRACGDGVCLPESALSLSVPVSIAT